VSSSRSHPSRNGSCQGTRELEQLAAKPAALPGIDDGDGDFRGAAHYAGLTPARPRLVSRFPVLSGHFCSLCPVMRVPKWDRPYTIHSSTEAGLKEHCSGDGDGDGGRWRWRWPIVPPGSRA
jgi:hypothetical protein